MASIRLLGDPTADKTGQNVTVYLTAKQRENAYSVHGKSTTYSVQDSLSTMGLMPRMGNAEVEILLSHKHCRAMRLRFEVKTIAKYYLSEFHGKSAVIINRHAHAIKNDSSGFTVEKYPPRRTRRARRKNSRAKHVLSPSKGRQGRKEK